MKLSLRQLLYPDPKYKVWWNVEYNFHDFPEEYLVTVNDGMRIIVRPVLNDRKGWDLHFIHKIRWTFAEVIDDVAYDEGEVLVASLNYNSFIRFHGKIIDSETVQDVTPKWVPKVNGKPTYQKGRVTFFDSTLEEQEYFPFRIDLETPTFEQILTSDTDVLSIWFEQYGRSVEFLSLEKGEIRRHLLGGKAKKSVCWETGVCFYSGTINGFPCKMEVKMVERESSRSKGTPREDDEMDVADEQLTRKEGAWQSLKIEFPVMHFNKFAVQKISKLYKDAHVPLTKYDTSPVFVLHLEQQWATLTQANLIYDAYSRIVMDFYAAKNESNEQLDRLIYVQNKLGWNYEQRILFKVSLGPNSVVKKEGLSHPYYAKVPALTGVDLEYKQAYDTLLQGLKKHQPITAESSERREHNTNFQRLLHTTK